MIVLGILKNALQTAPHVDPPIGNDNVEAVRENTVRNANLGARKRRTTSFKSETGGANGIGSRRQSTSVSSVASTGSNHGTGVPTTPNGTSAPYTDSNNTRLKWDEVNLYLTEQQRDSTMKITEPKTPYAPQYNPDDDMDDISEFGSGGYLSEAVNGAAGAGVGPSSSNGGLDMSKLDHELENASVSSGSKRVLVKPEGESLPGPDGMDDDPDAGLTPAQLEEKHQEFEKHRKEHYKMPGNVKMLLG